MIACQSARLVFSMVRQIGLMPALFTRMSMWPKRARAASRSAMHVGFLRDVGDVGGGGAAGVGDGGGGLVQGGLGAAGEQDGGAEAGQRLGDAAADAAAGAGDDGGLVGEVEQGGVMRGLRRGAAHAGGDGAAGPGSPGPAQGRGDHLPHAGEVKRGLAHQLGPCFITRWAIDQRCTSEGPS